MEKFIRIGDDPQVRGIQSEARCSSKALLLNTVKELKGSMLRMFMAQTVQALDEGGQRLAERGLGWNRGTMRKGMHEQNFTFCPASASFAARPEQFYPQGLF